MSGRAAHLQQTIKQGEELVANNHFGADKIKERILDIQVRRTWNLFLFFKWAQSSRGIVSMSFILKSTA